MLASIHKTVFQFNSKVRPFQPAASETVWQSNSNYRLIHNGISCTGKVSSLYWIGAPGESLPVFTIFSLDVLCSYWTDVAEKIRYIMTLSYFPDVLPYSFVYTSWHCRRWRSRMEVTIMAGSLFVHCKIAYFYSVTPRKWHVVSLPHFLTMRKTHLSISCKIFSSIRTTKLKIHAIEFCDFIKDFVVPSGLFVPCSLTVTRTWRPRLTAHCPIGERH